MDGVKRRVGGGGGSSLPSMSAALVSSMGMVGLRFEGGTADS